MQYRDSEPSEFAHEPSKQEMDLSCFPGRLSPIGRSHRLDSVELGVIHIVASSFSVLVAFAHVIGVFMAHHHAAAKNQSSGDQGYLLPKAFLSWLEAKELAAVKF